MHKKWLSIEEFDLSRAMIHKRELFQRLRVKESTLFSKAIEAGEVQGDEDLLVVERDGHYLALLMRQMAYHHVAQGELADRPFVVTF